MSLTLQRVDLSRPSANQVQAIAERQLRHRNEPRSAHSEEDTESAEKLKSFAFFNAAIPNSAVSPSGFDSLQGSSPSLHPGSSLVEKKQPNASFPDRDLKYFPPLPGNGFSPSHQQSGESSPPCTTVVVPRETLVSYETTSSAAPVAEKLQPKHERPPWELAEEEFGELVKNGWVGKGWAEAKAAASVGPLGGENLSWGKPAAATNPFAFGVPQSKTSNSSIGGKKLTAVETSKELAAMLTF